MKFNEFDNNTSDFFIKISNGGKSFDIEKAFSSRNRRLFLIHTNYQVYAYLIEKELTKHPDLSKLSPALFWDTRVEKLTG